MNFIAIKTIIKSNIQRTKKRTKTTEVKNWYVEHEQTNLSKELKQKTIHLAAIQEIKQKEN